MSELVLKSCPFCQSAPQSRMCDTDRAEPYVGVRCEHHTQWITMEQWNRRAALQSPAQAEGPEKPEQFRWHNQGMCADRHTGYEQYVKKTDYDRLSAQLAAVRERSKRDGNWLDHTGCCKVCDGEIPDGHTDNCDIWKLEQRAASAEELLRECRDELQESIENEGKLASFKSLVKRIDTAIAATGKKEEA